MKHTATQCQRG